MTTTILSHLAKPVVCPRSITLCVPFSDLIEALLHLSPISTYCEFCRMVVCRDRARGEGRAPARRTSGSFPPGRVPLLSASSTLRRRSASKSGPLGLNQQWLNRGEGVWAKRSDSVPMNVLHYRQETPAPLAQILKVPGECQKS